MTGNQPKGKGWTERWYRAMLLGYPREYRERHGGELLGTLLEAQPSQRRPSLRESASLLDSGMLTRLRSRRGTVPAWADGLQLGLLVLVLVRAGSLLGNQFTAHQQPEPAILVTALLAAVAVLLGRMGIATVVAAVAAVLTTLQALMTSPHGTDYLAGNFSSRAVEVSSAVNFWMNAGPTAFWLIAIGSAVLALRRGTRGAQLRRSWWWLTVLLAEAAFTSFDRTLQPTLAPPNHLAPTVPGSALAMSMVPLIVTIGFLLVALRATVVIGDPRWTIATGVYLAPLVVFAVALMSAQPSAIVALDYELPIVLLAAASAVILLRRAPRRSES